MPVGRAAAFGTAATVVGAYALQDHLRSRAARREEEDQKRAIMEMLEREADLVEEEVHVRTAVAAVHERQRMRMTLVENTGFACPSRFPFNMLRNIALSRCIEPIC